MLTEAHKQRRVEWAKRHLHGNWNCRRRCHLTQRSLIFDVDDVLDFCSFEVWHESTVNTCIWYLLMKQHSSCLEIQLRDGIKVNGLYDEFQKIVLKSLRGVAL